MRPGLRLNIEANDSTERSVLISTPTRTYNTNNAAHDDVTSPQSETNIRISNARATWDAFNVISSLWEPAVMTNCCIPISWTEVFLTIYAITTGFLGNYNGITYAEQNAKTFSSLFNPEGAGFWTAFSVACFLIANISVAIRTVQLVVNDLKRIYYDLIRHKKGSSAKRFVLEIAKLIIVGGLVVAAVTAINEQNKAANVPGVWGGIVSSVSLLNATLRFIRSGAN